jgi:DNA polymerase
MLITLDLETYYDRDYSLSKLTTEAYIRDPQFQVIGMGVKIDDGETKWYPKPEVKRAVLELPWSQSFVICQNTAFDGAILSWKYGVKPKAWVDIMGMSRALYPHEKSHSLKAQAERECVGIKGDEVIAALGKRYLDFTPEELDRYGEYCKNDVELTKSLFDIYMQRGFPLQELKLLDLTLRMYIEPSLRLDVDALQQHLKDVQDAKAALLESVKGSTEGDVKSVLMSNPQFAQLLRSFGVEPPKKVSPTTGKETYAFAKTDEDFKALAEHDDPRVQALVAARLGTKTTIEETRTERFIDMASRGAFPVPLRYYGAHSGRWSGQDSINLQNLPSRGANAGKIKKAIRPPEGHVIIDCDSSQIEARTLAWLAGQDDLVQAFEDKQDVYRIMASRIYSKPPEEVTSAERFIGKSTVLGAGYGVGHKKLRMFLKTGGGVDVGEVEAKRIVDTYRSTYDKIPELWRKGEDALTALANAQHTYLDPGEVIRVVPTMGLRLPNGLYIQYPNLRRVMEDQKPQWSYTSKGLPVRIYGGKVIENVCQAIARCVIGEQMLRIAKRYRPVLTVHDAIAIVAPIDEAVEARAFVEECMSWRPKWAQGLPLACESGMGETYGDC